MNRLYCLRFLFAALALLALSACGRAEVFRTCTTDAECPQGLCVQGMCSDTDPNPDAGDNANPGDDVGPDAQTDADDARECSTNEDCGEFEFCSLDNVCVDADCEPCADGTVPVGHCECAAVGCEANADCADGLVCTDAVCSPCVSNDQCSSDGSSFCGIDGRCEPAQQCSDDDGCPPNEQCSDDGQCVPRRQCTLDRDCGAQHRCIGGQCNYTPECTSDDDCGPFAECISDICHAAVCRGAEDCAEGELCDAGRCIVPPVSKRCTIATTGGPIAPNQRIGLEAFAWDEGGNGVAATFVWSSSNPAVAAIEGATLVGGTGAGATTVTAALAGGDPIQCEGEITFTNPGLVQPGNLRVVVTHAESLRPVAGAEVVVNGGTPVRTDANGLAALPRPEGPYELSVFADGFNYLTLQGINAPDVRVPLSPERGAGPVAGFTGEFDLSRVVSSGEVNLGLAGASLAGGTLDIDLERLLGESFTVELSLPGIGGGTFPLPGGVVGYGGVLGFQLDIKRKYYATSAEGARLGWGLAGRVPLRDLMGLVQGGGDMSDVLGTILPLFSRFDHALQPMHLTELPRVVDSNDINGNLNRTEYVPDYLNFPVHSLQPHVRQNMATDIAISNFPMLRGAEAEIAVLVGGTLLESTGFVPLGINATTDGDGDGRPDARTLYMAPTHGSATGGRYSIMALAFGTSGGSTQGMMPDEFSAALWNGQSMPTSVSLGTFPDSSSGTIHTNRRVIDIETNAGPVYRVRLVGAERSWDIWTMGPPGTMAQYEHTFVVPAVPAGREDLFTRSTILLDAIRTAVTLDDLVRATGVGLRNAGLVTTSYNRTRLR